MQRVNLALRALMELGIVVALAYSGAHIGRTPSAKIALGIAEPLVDFHQAGQYAEALRLTEEMLISLAAAAAWYAAGARLFGWLLAALSIVYHISVYAAGARLLRR